MKLTLIIIVAALVAISSTSPVPGHLKHETIESTRFLLMKNPETNQLEYVDLLSQNVTAKAQPSDVFYYLYSKQNTGGVKITEVSDTTTNFDKNKPTIFIVHGWNNDHTSSVNTKIKTAFLENYDVNVFCTDWGTIAHENYITAQLAVPEIGGFIGEFIQQLMSDYGIDSSSILLVGHSLGAHVAGCAGAKLNGQIGHIVGLDPAGPLFTIFNTDNRIDPSDGRFVEIIHTSDLLGFNLPIGHSDYYPNGGNSQPGCGVDLAKTCAHGRSYDYYAESLSSPDFVGQVCDSQHDFERGACSGNTKSIMGQYECSKTTGSIHLNTNSEAPFARGDKI